MIRLFTALCKALLEDLSDEQIFQAATTGFSHHGTRCPKCGATGKLSAYGGYSRGTVSRRDSKTVTYSTWIDRFECGSCGATHALLPDILIPHSQYTLNFKLSALVAYFERKDTVINICSIFEIAVSTIYRWIELMSRHWELMLGVLISRKTSALGFLLGLLGSDTLSVTLHIFFNRYGFSFMQNRSASAARSNSP